MQLQRNLHNNKFEGNLTMNAVITLWKSHTKCWNISSWIPSSDELPWLPIDFINS
jgi:hypothetical protein